MEDATDAANCNSLVEIGRRGTGLAFMFRPNIFFYCVTLTVPIPHNQYVVEGQKGAGAVE